MKQGLACYVVGKIFLYGISFNIGYNELGKENMNNFEYLFFQSSGKNINHFKTEMEEHETACVVIYTYSTTPLNRPSNNRNSALTDLHIIFPFWEPR